MASFSWSRVLRRGPALPPCRRRANAPALECLEDRTLPAVNPLAALVLPPPLPVGSGAVVGPAAAAVVEVAVSAGLSGSATGGSNTAANNSGGTNPSSGGGTSQGSGSSGGNTNGNSTPRTGTPGTGPGQPPPSPGTTGANRGGTPTSNGTDDANGQSQQASDATVKTTDGTTADPNANNNTPSEQTSGEGGPWDFDPALGAVLSRVLSSPLVGSGALAALAMARIESFHPGPAAVAEETTLGVEPLPVNVTGPRGLGTGASANAAGVNDSAPSSPSRVVFTTDSAPGLSSPSFASSTGALRFQGIDFRPLNSSGVGVVGTALAGVDGPNPEGQQPSAGAPPATLPGGPAAADNRTPAAPDAALKKFLLGVEPPAPAKPAPGAAAPVPAGVGQAPGRPGGPAAFDDVFAGGPEADDTEGDDEAGSRDAPVALLVAPFLYLQWFPVASSRGKKLPVGCREPGDPSRAGRP
jgi:hypothetical protein